MRQSDRSTRCDNQYRQHMIIHRTGCHHHVTCTRLRRGEARLRRVQSSRYRSYDDHQPKNHDLNYCSLPWERAFSGNSCLQVEIRTGENHSWTSLHSNNWHTHRLDCISYHYSDFHYQRLSRDFALVARQSRVR